MLGTRAMIISKGTISNIVRGIARSCVIYQSSSDGTLKTFDESLLQNLACPLSKKPLRYDKERNELISDEIGVAYPIIDGIPNLIPQDARMLKTNSSIDTKQSQKPEES